MTVKLGLLALLEAKPDNGADLAEFDEFGSAEHAEHEGGEESGSDGQVGLSGSKVNDRIDGVASTEGEMDDVVQRVDRKDDHLGLMITLVSASPVKAASIPVTMNPVIPATR